MNARYYMKSFLQTICLHTRVLSYYQKSTRKSIYSSLIKILATYKASGSTQKRCVIFSEEKVPILYEDNVAWVTQLKEEYIEGYKHILLKFFSNTVFNRSYTKLMCVISDMLSDIFIRGRKYALHSFFLGLGFIPMGFPDKVFNEAANNAYYKICVLFCPSLGFFSHMIFV